MANINVNGARLHYEIHGEGSETIVFAHGLLFSGKMFEEQVKALQERYRCITFDFRGQGQSEVTPSGYGMENLYQDTVALIEQLACAPCHFLGLSMGGFIGLRLAIRRPELLRSLMLVETTADAEPVENVLRYRQLNFIARCLGLRPVINQVMRIMFGRTFLHDPARDRLRELWKRRILGNRRIGITRAVRGVIERQGVYDELHKINLPTLILVGEEDVATVPAVSDRMHQRIARSQLIVIPKAGHTSTIEEPEKVNAALRRFLGAASETGG